MAEDMKTKDYYIVYIVVIKKQSIPYFNEIVRNPNNVEHAREHD